MIYLVSHVSSRPNFILWNWGINLFFGLSGALTRRGGLLPDTPLLTNCQQREYMGRERDILGNLADFCYNWQCHNKVRKMNSEPVKLIALLCTLACEECEVWPISPLPPSSTTAPPSPSTLPPPINPHLLEFHGVCRQSRIIWAGILNIQVSQFGNSRSVFLYFICILAKISSCLTWQVN